MVPILATLEVISSFIFHNEAIESCIIEPFPIQLFPYRISALNRHIMKNMNGIFQSAFFIQFGKRLACFAFKASASTECLTERRSNSSTGISYGRVVVSPVFVFSEEPEGTAP